MVKILIFLGNRIGATRRRVVLRLRLRATPTLDCGNSRCRGRTPGAPQAPSSTRFGRAQPARINSIFCGGLPTWSIPSRGFSLIELLVVIALSTLLLGLGTFSYQWWMVQQRVQMDTQTIFHALNTAREMAMLQGHVIEVHGWNAQVHLAKNKEMLQAYGLTQYNHIIIKSFPQSKDEVFIFYPNGRTASQNASIYICPEIQTQFAQKVVINQAGRIYVSTENIEGNC